MHEGQPDGQDAESVASIVRVRRPPIESKPEAAVARPLTAPNNLLGNNQTSRISPFLSNPSSQLSRAGSKRKSMREESEELHLGHCSNILVWFHQGRTQTLM